MSQPDKYEEAKEQWIIKSQENIKPCKDPRHHGWWECTDGRIWPNKEMAEDHQYQLEKWRR